MSTQPEDKKGQDDPEELSRAWDWHVRRKVAWSADTPEKILDTLSRDKVQWVREAVAGNSRASPQALARLAEDSSGYVRSAVALNSRATSEILEMLAADEMVDYDSTLQKNRYLVKEAAAKSPNINPPTLAFLARDSDEHVRAAAASNPLLLRGIDEQDGQGCVLGGAKQHCQESVHPGGSAHLSLCRQDHGCAGHGCAKSPHARGRRWRHSPQTGAGR